MTKKDIAKRIADHCGVTIVLAGQIVQMVFDQIINTLETEGRIELRNFGVFEVRMRRARTARNPTTGGQVAVPARQVVTFQAGRDMKERVQKVGVGNGG